MHLQDIKERIKESMHSGADRFLPARLKDELGLNRPNLDTLHVLSQNADLDSNLTTFFKPVNSTFLSGRDYKNLQRWAMIFVAILSGLLLILFSSLIVPHKDYSNALEDTQVIVRGINLNQEKAKPSTKIVYDKLNSEDGTKEELKVRNLHIKKTPPAKLATKSPLLQTKTPTLVEHTVRSGDNLEIIADKYFHNHNIETIEKLKKANNIRNSRSLQIGQKLTIPV